MKFALFDGILETHVASSLERALIKSGNEVLNTSKIGSGFKFPSLNADLGKLENSVQAVLEFRPDVVFVMRPCSLPPKLFQKLKFTGATMIAWFSDDPVLFDLSYGPVVDLYDLVLHCGNATVLRYYEEFFGRPTGVNFPFWSDHEAFPYVWGSENPTTDFMFLGNVQDEVRRSRYFELAKIPQSVRIHGNVGSDYFGISGGYLDSDAEVVASGATTRMALNIPQFFRNHRQLETWFDGLDALGFFEYPSRVVQYMAMGVPTISVIPGVKEFRSYPEMKVASDIEEASKFFEEAEPRLEELSLETLSRFDRHFSADSRVMALENLLHDDSWKNLDAFEREVWFTQFDGQEAGVVSGKVETDQQRVLIKEPQAKSEKGRQIDRPHVIVLGDFSNYGGWTRAKTIADAFKNKADVIREDFAGCKDILVKDPSHICSTAVNVTRIRGIQDNSDARDDRIRRILVVVGRNLAITAAGKKFLEDRHIRVVLVEDSENLTYKQKFRQITGFDFVAYGIKEVADDIRSRGFSNVDFWPIIPDREFIEEVSVLPDNQFTSILRIRDKRQTEEVVAPCYSKDLSSAAVARVFDLAELQSMNRNEVVEALACHICLASYGGTRQYPRLQQIFVNAVGASELSFFSRCPVLGRIYPFNRLAVLVANIGELSAKTMGQLGNQEQVERYQRQVHSALEELECVHTKIVEMLCSEENDKFVDEQALSRSTKLDIPFHSEGNRSNPNTATVKIDVKSVFGSINEWSLNVKLNGEQKFQADLREKMELVIPSVKSDSRVFLEAEYKGSGILASTNRALNIDATIFWSRDRIVGSSSHGGILVRK